jgi:hypothetical protein
MIYSGHILGTVSRTIRKPWTWCWIDGRQSVLYEVLSKVRDRDEA